MKFFNGRYYVEVKDPRYRIYSAKNVKLGIRDDPKSLRTQNQDRNDTQIRKNQKVLGKNNNDLEVKIYPKNKKQTIQQSKIKDSISSICKTNFG